MNVSNSNATPLGLLRIYPERRRKQSTMKIPGNGAGTDVLDVQLPAYGSSYKAYVINQ